MNAIQIVDLQTWTTFAVTWFLVSIPLGPNALHSMTMSIVYGFPKAVMVPLGILVATIVYSILVSIGIGAVLVTSEDLFSLIQFAGACYIIYLGVGLWRSQSGSLAISADNRDDFSSYRLFLRGMLVSLSNPKALLAYLAVFPHFVDQSVSLPPQLALIIPTVATISFFVYLGYALLAVPLRRVLSTDSRKRRFNRFSGSLFCIIGLALLYGNLCGLIPESCIVY